MRNRSPRLFVSLEMLLVALVLQTMPFDGLLYAQGLLKRKPLPESIQNQTEAEDFLSNLSVDALLGYERVEPVCTQFLTRNGVPEFARLEAVKRLAEMQQSDPVTVLLGWIEKFDANATSNAIDRETLRDLAALLPQQPVNSLQKSREQLAKFATHGRHDATRQSAMAARIAADRSFDAAWALANESSQSLLDLLRCVPQLPSDLPRDALFRNVRPLLKAEDQPAIQSAAIEAAALLDDNGRGTFETLSDFIQQGVHPEACVRAICNIPSDQWTDSHRKPLADHLIARLGEMPIQQRMSREARDSIKLIKTLAARMPSQDEADIRDRLDNYAIVTIRLTAMNGERRFAPDVLAAQAGKGIQIVLRNSDAEPHNLVVIDSNDVRESFAQPATKSQPENDAGKTKLPTEEQIIGEIQAVPAGETGSITFQAPDEPRILVFASTLADNWPKMYGVLIIVEDVEAYRAEHESLPTATEVLGTREQKQAAGEPK